MKVRKNLAFCSPFFAYHMATALLMQEILPKIHIIPYLMEFVNIYHFEKSQFLVLFERKFVDKTTLLL